MEDRARILEDQVEDLTRAIAKTINEAEVPGRPGIRSELKDFAISLLQDSVAPPEPEAVEAVESGNATFNPLAMGIPLFFAGGVLHLFVSTRRHDALRGLGGDDRVGVGNVDVHATMRRAVG